MNELKSLCLSCGLDPDRIAPTASSYQHLAEMLGLSRGALKVAGRKAGFPAKGADGYDTGEAIKFLIDAGTLTEISGSEARRLKTLAEVRRLEFDLATRKGELIEAAEVERVWTKTRSALDSHIDRKAQHMAHRFLACETPAAVLKLIRELWFDVKHATAMDE